MNRFFTICFSCVFSLATGCSWLSGTGPEGGSGDRFNETIGSCNPAPCVRISLDAIPQLPDAVSAELKALIARDVGEVLYAPIDSDEKAQSKDLLMAEIQERFKEFTEPGLSDAPVDWELTRTAAILFQNSDVITIDVRSEGFIGGAHGFNDRTLMSFGVASGRRLALKDLIEPASEPIFHKLVEDQFRRAREIPPAETLADEARRASRDRLVVEDGSGAGVLPQPRRIQVHLRAEQQVLVVRRDVDHGDLLGLVRDEP